MSIVIYAIGCGTYVIEDKHPRYKELSRWCKEHHSANTYSYNTVAQGRTREQPLPISNGYIVWSPDVHKTLEIIVGPEYNTTTIHRLYYSGLLPRQQYVNWCNNNNTPLPLLRHSGRLDETTPIE